MKNKIKIYNDDDPFSVISKINDIIKSCKMEIVEKDSFDDYVEYEMVQYDDKGDKIC